MHKSLLRVLRPILAILVALSPAAAQETYTADNPAQIHMVVWRGCESACQGFSRYFDDRGLPVEVSVTDVARDKSKLPEVRAALIDERPDLVVTWGTSVSVSILGTIEDFGAETALGDIPALFMIVADPVGSNLIEDYAATGRPNLTGVRNRVPEKVQLDLLFDYYFPKRLAVINNPRELNSALNTEALRALSQEMGFELIERLYTVPEGGTPDPVEIPKLMVEVKAAGADAVYVGSSSFNLEYRDVFTSAAVRQGLPVFSAYEAMVREGDAVMAVANSYANVGKLAARQAQKVLLEGAAPGRLPVASLDRFSLFLNIGAARKIGLYPPLQLLTIAEIIE